ncbi:hypothetical protein DJ66_0830 [Candidatus Liberibacter solanacearum]|uniref:Uncharacterized protein n=1 Tax=Candidatus Liberibacter solanacearum TaxID=556287 RepID=A0A0F4VLE1_9HYPH|nr:hypothetical protein DJ66_0830 [Candidatus Liberibacter solanacearum]
MITYKPCRIRQIIIQAMDLELFYVRIALAFFSSKTFD